MASWGLADWALVCCGAVVVVWENTAKAGGGGKGAIGPGCSTGATIVASRTTEAKADFKVASVTNSGAVACCSFRCCCLKYSCPAFATSLPSFRLLHHFGVVLPMKVSVQRRLDLAHLEPHRAREDYCSFCGTSLEIAGPSMEVGISLRAYSGAVYV